ncbi:MAG: thiamine pyrophosphate enzyme, C-terminal TPP binding domain protein, partial [uncultured archaeon A07HR67]
MVVPEPGDVSGTSGLKNARQLFGRPSTSASKPLLRDDPPVTSVRARRALRATRRALLEDLVVTVDTRGSRVWALDTFETGPRRYVDAASWASIGTAASAAIGAQLANPDTDVVALRGDGGLLMCVYGLHTAVAEGLPVAVVVFDSRDSAITSDAADRQFDLPEEAHAWADTPLDFTQVVRDTGMETARAETPTGVRPRGPRRSRRATGQRLDDRVTSGRPEAAVDT